MTKIAKNKVLRATDSLLWEFHRGILKDKKKGCSDAEMALAKLLVRRGGFFEPHPGPLKEADMRVPKEAWANCQIIALGEDEEWYSDDCTYCEGFALDLRQRKFGHHGWLVNADGVVIDPTNRAPDPERVSYFGMPVNCRFLEWKADGSEMTDGMERWSPIDWANIPDGWSIDQMVLPVSGYKKAIRAYGSKPYPGVAVVAEPTCAGLGTNTSHSPTTPGYAMGMKPTFGWGANTNEIETPATCTVVMLPEELLSMLIEYRKYDVRMHDSTIVSFAVTLCNLYGDSSLAESAREKGALALGQISILGLPGGDPDPLVWELVGDPARITLSASDPELDKNLLGTCSRLLAEFFDDIKDTAPDLASLSLIGLDIPESVEIVAKARADCSRREVRHLPTIH